MGQSSLSMCEVSSGGRALGMYRFGFDKKTSRLTTRVFSFVAGRWRPVRSKGWVRLYSLDELTAILKHFGMQVDEVFGDVRAGIPFKPDSFRMVLYGHKVA